MANKKPAQASIVDDFVTAYAREYDFYREAARICHHKCGILLIPSCG